MPGHCLHPTGTSNYELWVHICTEASHLDIAMHGSDMSVKVPYKVWAKSHFLTITQRVHSCCEGSLMLMEADERGQEGTNYTALLLESLFPSMIE